MNDQISTMNREFSVSLYHQEGHILVWRKEDGTIHREDGPAIINEKLNETTWMNVERSEIYLASVVYSNFPENNKRVPKIISTKYAWCLEGKSYTFPEWCKILKKTDEEIVLLKITY